MVKCDNIGDDGFLIRELHIDICKRSKDRTNILSHVWVFFFFSFQVNSDLWHAISNGSRCKTLILFSFLHAKRAWHFIQIVFIRGDNLNEMTNFDVMET